MGVRVCVTVFARVSCVCVLVIAFLHVYVCMYVNMYVCKYVCMEGLTISPIYSADSVFEHDYKHQTILSCVSQLVGLIIIIILNTRIYCKS